MKNKLLDYIEKYSKKRDEELVYDFMPSLLEIIERPAHIGGKVIIWGVFGLICFFILWASLAKVEVVASAQGNIAAVADGERICADAAYKVLVVHVEQGQMVSAGDLLIEMELEGYEKDKAELETEITNLQNQIAVYQKILAENSVRNIDVSSYANQTQIQSIVDNFKNYGGSSQYQNSMRSSMESATESMQNYQDALNELNEHYANAKIYAPYDAVVQELWIDSNIKNVNEMQELLTIVPSDSDKRMECYLSDADIADIKEGQEVNVKLAAYPYSDYGTLDGEISFVSNVATQIEGVGTVYTVYVDIEDEKWQEKMKIGMQGSAELVIGKRRIIEYLMEPVTGALNESMKEK